MYDGPPRPSVSYQFSYHQLLVYETGVNDVAVRIRLKKMGRKHRPFFRVCAIDGRRPRDGKVIEELGHYDPMVNETDARAVLNGERIDYWLGVGAQPSDNVRVLIKKYGTNGTHLGQQKEAIGRLGVKPQAPPPMKVALPKAEPPAVESAPAEAAEQAEDAPAAAGEAPAAEAPAAEAPTAEAPAAEAAPEEKAASEES